MKNSISSGLKTNQVAYYSVSLVGCFTLYSAHVYAAGDLLGIPNSATTNESNVGNNISVVCPFGDNGAEFQARCNALVKARPIVNPQGPNITNQQLTGVLGKVTSEQTAAQNTQALEMNNNQITSLSNRISAIRSGRQSGRINIAGLMFDNNGNPVSTTQLAKLNDTSNKAAAGDDSFDRLGVFVNGDIGFGDRRTTTNEAGYNLNTHGVTAGVDYRFTDNFLLGTAFGYNNATSGYYSNLGKLEADSYSGAIYGSFYTEGGFFVDGIFSGSHVDYASTRHIQYSLPTETTPNGIINTDALGSNQGDEFNVAMTSGNNFKFGGLTVTPQIRVDYTTSQVDALNEQGGLGWALHVDQQSFESLQTAPGLQLAYAISLPWAVIIPMARAEYIHEFKNDSRNINTYFVQDPRQIRFNILTDKPDRDYIIASAGISAQFAHGISAFVNYDTVQANYYVNNHNFTGGVRMELPF
jgi:outer membrane autotransporter protein